MKIDIDYLLFDAANTLIHKPDLWRQFIMVLESHSIDIPVDDLKVRHKIISEILVFPDQTSETFYREFNYELLTAFGVVPSNNLLDDIYLACKNLPWVAFEDVRALKNTDIKLGILSNFNSNLELYLEQTMPNITFENLFISEQEGLRKPDRAFFEKATESIGIEPERIMYIGDSLKLDVIPASTIGMQTRLIDRDNIFRYSPLRLNSLYEINNF